MYDREELPAWHVALWLESTASNPSLRCHAVAEGCRCGLQLDLPGRRLGPRWLIIRDGSLGVRFDRLQQDFEMAGMKLQLEPQILFRVMYRPTAA